MIYIDNNSPAESVGKLEKMFPLSSRKRTIIQCGLSGLGAMMLLTWVHVRPLGIFFLAVILFWLYKTRCTIRIVPPPEIQTKYDYSIDRLGRLRHSNPGLFCTITSVVLGVLAIVGHLLSGSTVVLIGLVCAAIISTKYNFKLIKIEQKDFIPTENAPHQYADVEEFLPEENDTNLFLLQRASDQATVSSAIEDPDDDKSDEIPSELLIPDSIPEIDENSSDDEDDLSIGVPIEKVKLLSASVIEKTASAAINPYSEIEFKKGHFKKDSSISSTSSSSDEESLSKGLTFPEYSIVDGSKLQNNRRGQQQQHYEDEMNPLLAAAIKSQAKSLLANSNILPNFVSGIVQWSLRGGGNNGGGFGSSSSSGGPIITEITHTDQIDSSSVTACSVIDSSDNSDFEMLDAEEFNLN